MKIHGSVSDRTVASSSIRIWHENLAAAGPEGSLPLSSLAAEQHIHGGLRIEIGGRLVPCLGYFGPDAVCFDTWLEELTAIYQRLVLGGDFTHVFDEGEQGQPAFVFERQGDKLLFSISDAEFSGGMADAAWQQVEFEAEDFRHAYQAFLDSLLATLKCEASPAAQQWLSNRMMAAVRGKEGPVLLDCEIWRDGGSLSAILADRGSTHSFWLQTKQWDRSQDAGHEHLFVSKGLDPTSKEKKIEMASTTERRWLAFLREATTDLLELNKQALFKRLLSILHHRTSAPPATPGDFAKPHE